MISLAFYRSRLDGKLWDNAVNLFSGLHGYAHVELVIDDTSYSSTSRDGQDGPRSMHIDYREHPERWRFYRFDEIGPAGEACIRLWCEWCIAQRYTYDWGSVLRFVLPWAKESETAYMCSEFCLTALRQGGYLLDGPPAHRVSPNRLARMVGL